MKRAVTEAVCSGLGGGCLFARVLLNAPRKNRVGEHSPTNERSACLSVTARSCELRSREARVLPERERSRPRRQARGRPQPPQAQSRDARSGSKLLSPSKRRL